MNLTPDPVITAIVRREDRVLGDLADNRNETAVYKRCDTRRDHAG